MEEILNNSANIRPQTIHQTINRRASLRKLNDQYDNNLLQLANKEKYSAAMNSNQLENG